MESSAPVVARESHRCRHQHHAQGVCSVDYRVDSLARRQAGLRFAAADGKAQNIQRTGRAAITVIKLENRRYITVEGAASIEPWQNTPAHIKRLKDFYGSMGRTQKGTDEDFARQMREEERSLILITPEHVYGSLQSGA
jgi:hypothetical protein